jgi:hypothetical protein
MDITPIKIEVEVSVETIEAILDSFLEHTYGTFSPEVLEKAGMPSKKVYTERILSDPKFTEMIIGHVREVVEYYTDDGDMCEDMSDTGYDDFVKTDDIRCAEIHREILTAQRKLEEKQRREKEKQLTAEQLKNKVAASRKFLKDNGYTVTKTKVKPEVNTNENP